MLQTLKKYYLLSKPGIVRANAMTAGAGYLFASRGSIEWIRFVATLVGTGLVIVCGCVLNNYLDRGIDSKMKRTQKRASVTGEVSVRAMLLYASVSGISGLIILWVQTNLLTVVIGLLALVSYVLIYGYFKRRSPISTEVGTIPGAASILAGYTAVTNNIDGAAALLFLLMVIWQVPHFYAIGIFRSKEYAAAKLPILPLVKGEASTRNRIFIYVSAFMFTIFLFTLLGHGSRTFGVVVGLAAAYWLFVALQGFDVKDFSKWAGKVFGISLIVLLIMSVVLSINYWLP